MLRAGGASGGSGSSRIVLDSIVGTVDRGREFDRSFKPTTNRVRTRWERIATAQRKGREMPPSRCRRCPRSVWPGGSWTCRGRPDLDVESDAPMRMVFPRGMGQVRPGPVRT